MAMTREQRFWSYVDRKGPDDCWPWTRSKDKTGYGHFGNGIGGKVILAHRQAFLFAGGVVTKEKPYVLHSCDFRPCCNPAHLRAGTHKENMQDRNARGRTATGAKNGRSAARRAATKEQNGNQSF
jgi:hypothetical protein